MSHNTDTRAIEALATLLNLCKTLLDTGSFYSSAIELDGDLRGDDFEEQLEAALAAYEHSTIPEAAQVVQAWARLAPAEQYILAHYGYRERWEDRATIAQALGVAVSAIRSMEAQARQTLLHHLPYQTFRRFLQGRISLPPISEKPQS